MLLLSTTRKPYVTGERRSSRSLDNTLHDLQLRVDSSDSPPIILAYLIEEYAGEIF